MSAVLLLVAALSGRAYEASSCPTRARARSLWPMA